jgi:hypothetical protein
VTGDVFLFFFPETDWKEGSGWDNSLRTGFLEERYFSLSLSLSLFLNLAKQEKGETMISPSWQAINQPKDSFH